MIEFKPSKNIKCLGGVHAVLLVKIEFFIDVSIIYYCKTDLNKVIFRGTNILTDRLHEFEVLVWKHVTKKKKKKSKLKIKNNLSTGISIETSKNLCLTINFTPYNKRTHTQAVFLLDQSSSS